MTDYQDLKIIIASRASIVVIETYEELRAINLVIQVGVTQGKPVFTWSITEGLLRADQKHKTAQRLTSDPDAALGQIKATGRSGIYVLCDFHPYLENMPKNVRLLKEIAMQEEQSNHTVVLLSHRLSIPPEIKRYSAQITMSLPNDQQLLHLVKEEASARSKKQQGKKVATDSKSLRQLVSNLKGLTYADARRLARGAIIDDGAITEDDIPALNKAKFELMDMDGVLNFEFDTSSFSDVGGLANLKLWLEQRRYG